jgi:predicted Rossmann-fold nucleotide-binding protein
MKAVCVFAASSSAVALEFAAAAEELGALLARQGVTVVYGGGKVGLMGVVARAVHAQGGRVVAVPAAPGRHQVDANMKAIVNRHVSEFEKGRGLPSQAGCPPWLCRPSRRLHWWS